MSLTDNTPSILAYGNDLGYDRIFVEQLKNFGRPGAVLLAISGSGTVQTSSRRSSGPMQMA
jgi:D-sedoheptulose 7-phosphate isomerase